MTPSSYCHFVKTSIFPFASTELTCETLSTQGWVHQAEIRQGTLTGCVWPPQAREAALWGEDLWGGQDVQEACWNETEHPGWNPGESDLKMRET